MTTKSNKSGPASIRSGDILYSKKDVHLVAFSTIVTKNFIRSFQQYLESGSQVYVKYADELQMLCVL